MEMILNIAMKKPSLKSMKRALCIQPHPDDNEVGMGDAIAKFIQDGVEVHYLTITDGSLGLLDGSMTHQELAAKRKQEVIDSGNLLGVKAYHFLDYQDGTLHDIYKLSGEIAEIVREIKPDFMFCPDPWLNYEAHQDHIVTGKAASQCFITSWLYEYPLGNKSLPHKVTGIGFYHTAKPNVVINTTNTFKLKIEAMALHKTQFDKKTLNMLSLYFKEKAKKAAKDKKFKLGCGLKIMGQNHMHCFTDAEQV